jgi:hypothetical protein
MDTLLFLESIDKFSGELLAYSKGSGTSFNIDNLVKVKRLSEELGFSMFDDVIAECVSTINEGDLNKAQKKYLLDDQFDSEEDLELSDDDLDDLINNISDDEVIDLYDPTDFAFVSDAGEYLDDLSLEDLEESIISEVLSRQGRIKARMHFKMSRAKRLRGAKLALHRRSSSEKLHQKARRLASRVLKMKFVKKPLNTLSVAEKERLERRMARMKKTVQRLSTKMVGKIRKIETNRLSHKSYTK